MMRCKGAAELYPAPAGTSQPSSFAGHICRSPFCDAWLVTQRQLQFGALSSGVFEGSPGLIRPRHSLRMVRADAGFCDDVLLSFLEKVHLPYIVVAKLTRWVKVEAMKMGMSSTSASRPSSVTRLYPRILSPCRM